MKFNNFLLIGLIAVSSVTFQNDAKAGVAVNVAVSNASVAANAAATAARVSKGSKGGGSREGELVVTAVLGGVLLTALTIARIKEKKESKKSKKREI